MRLKPGVVALLVAAFVPVAAGVSVAKPKTSSPEERAKAVALAHELELQPAADDAIEKRRWLIAWWQKVPDLTVTICDLLGPVPKEDHPYFSEVLVQSMFSGGAFMIEHPDQAQDKVAVQTAGVEGALKVYEAFAKEMPDHRLPFLDDLLKKREAGTLAAHMRDAVAKGCS
jgi:hypothetical protein